MVAVPAQTRERSWVGCDDSFMAQGSCVGLPKRDRKGRVPTDGAFEADTARMIHFCEDRSDMVSKLLTLEAKRTCRECPVESKCLAYAIEAKIEHGIWGGMTPKERRALRKRRLAQVAV